MTQQKFLTPDELSALLGIKKHTLSVWRCYGKGPSYIKACGLVRYPESAVNEWLAERTVKNTAEAGAR